MRKFGKMVLAVLTAIETVLLETFFEGTAKHVEWEGVEAWPV